MGEPKNPAQAKLRDWPMFQDRMRQGKRNTFDGRRLPKISELLVASFAGSAAEKLAWLTKQKAAGNLDGDDPDEVAEAEALLGMLARLAGTKGRKQHLDDLLDEGLKETFPASDPVSIGHFTAREP